MEPAKCLICNNVVGNLPQHLQKHKLLKKDYFDKYLKNDTDGICVVCGQPTKFYTLTEGYKKFCSVKCAKKFQAGSIEKISEMLEKKKKTSLGKYGTDHPMQTDIVRGNHKKAIVEKYGVTHYSKTDDFKTKCKETCLEKYGVTHHNKTDEGKSKIKGGFLEKYGVENISFLEETTKKIKETKLTKYGSENYNNRDKAHQTYLEKYGVHHPSQSLEVKNKITRTRKLKFLFYLFKGNRLNGMVKPLFDVEHFTNVNQIYEFECNTCKTKFKDDLDDGLIPKCPVCFRNNNISLMEQDFLDYIRIPNTEEHRQVIISNYKVDGLKKDKIFEFLGDYWHGNPDRFLSEEMNHSNKKTFGELYKNTIDKLSNLKRLGFHIYYMWEKDWINWLKEKIPTLPIKKF